MCSARRLAISALFILACDSKKEGPVVEAPKHELSPAPAPPSIPIGEGSQPKGELTVVAARPTGDNDGMWAPVITFSKPIVALGMIGEGTAIREPAKIEPPLSGEWRWLGSSSVEFVLSKPMPFSTAFKVTVAPLTALDGSKMVAPHQFEFTTPVPVVWSSDPEDGFRWMVPNPVISIETNQAVKDLEKHARLDAGGRMISISVVKEVNVAAERRAKSGAAAEEEDPLRPQRATRYELKPSSALPLDTPVALIIDSGLAGKEGPRTMEKEARFSFRAHGPMKILSARACLFPEYMEAASCPHGPVILMTSNKVDAASLKGKISFEPPVAIDAERVESGIFSNSSAYFSVPGKFRPGQKYKVKVAAGAADEFQQVAPEFQGEIELDDVEPFLSIGPELALIEAEREGALPVESINIEDAEARVWTLPPEELAPHLAQAGKLLPAPSAAPATLPLPVSAKKNVRRTAPLKLRGETSKFGTFLVRVENQHLDTGRAAQVVAQVTDLAVHAKLGPKSGVVWVTSLSTGQPVPNAKIRVLDRSGLSKWTGAADADGVAKIPGVTELAGETEQSAWNTPFLLIAAENGGDTGFVVSSWNEGLSPSSFGLRTDWDGDKPRSLGLVFAERGIYRPGDRVHLFGVARYRRAGVIVKPEAGAKMALKVTSSRDTKVFEKSVAVNAFGTYSAEFVLDKEAPVGFYQIATTFDIEGQQLHSGGTFRVEEYRAPQFKVDVAAEKDVFAGELIEASVSARYLHGGAMAKAKVRYTIMRSTDSFTPPGNAGFAFGADVWSWEDGQHAPSSAIAGSGEGETDRQGAFQIKGAKFEAPGANAQQYTIEADVADVNRQHLANRALITVHPASAYAGVRLENTGFAQAGRPMRVELIAASPEGQRKSGVTIALEVKREDWKSIQKKGVGGQWFTTSERVETKVFSCSVKTEETPAFCEMKLEQPGYHVLEATLVDEAGRKQITRTGVYVIGSGWVSWQRNDTDRIDLVADKKIYAPGETAKILVKSPYPDAEALLTVEREGVLEVRRVKLGGAAAALEVKIDEAMIPNIFVGVLLVRGRVKAEGIEAGGDRGGPAVRVVYVELEVEKKEKRLAVKISPDAEKKRPREKVKVDLTVTDHRGRGVKSQLAVWAVDEGVLRLTNYRPPDPIEVVHPLRGLSVRIGEPLLHLVLARLYGEKGEEPGGSGGRDASGAGFRSKFKTTPFFAPAVNTDAEGRAQVEIELPDNVTTFRIMAFASTPGDRFGTGESSVTVTKPLLAIPALPRVARAGDTFEAGVVVHAEDSAGQATVRASATNLQLRGPAERVVSLAGGPQEVRFAFVAQEPVPAQLRFEVIGAGGARDAVEETLRILLPVSMESVAIYGETNEQSTEAIVTPGGVRPGIGGLDVTLASTILGGFDDGMRQLVEYPYGCLEQLSSRLVPFITLRELQKKFGGDPAAFLGRVEPPIDPEELVRRTVRAIEDLQRADGGYGYWPQSACSSDYGSAYAVLALSRARAAGHPVDAAGLEAGKRFLANTVAAGRAIDCGFGAQKPGDETRAFALYTLARAGSPKPSHYAELFARREQLPLFARAMLADAMHLGGGNKANAKQLVDELLNHAAETAGEVHIEEKIDARASSRLWSSDVRTTAILLGTLADVSPGHPFVAKIGRYLTKARKAGGRFRTTQEAAFTLLALSDVVRSKEKDTPGFDARVLLGDAELVRAAFQGRTMKIERASVPINDLLARGKKTELPFIFSKQGAGILYYGALLRYAPHEVPTQPLEAGMIVQRWFEPYAGGGQARAFEAGALVRVRLRLATSQERSFVVLEVPLPSGLEAVDTSLASTARLDAPREFGGEGEGEGFDGESEGGGIYDTAFYDPFGHVEYRDDRVVFFADSLPPGVHQAGFVARATTPGTFVLTPARAEEMYAPEVFGRSDGGSFVVGGVGEPAESAGK